MKKFLMIFLAAFALSTVALSAQVVFAGPKSGKERLMELMGGGQQPSAPAASSAGTKRSGGGGGGSSIKALTEQLNELREEFKELKKEEELGFISVVQGAVRDLVVWYFVLTCIAFALSVICCVLTLKRLPIAPKVTTLAHRIKALEDTITILVRRIKALEDSQPPPPPA